jgi:hypothetical protein
MGEPSDHGELTIILHNGHRYDLPYKHRQELLDYFTDSEVPRFIFQTKEGTWVYLQKAAIAAIEADSEPDRPKIQGFARIGEPAA